MILADEINRTPPKTQAALLEGMQEQQVTAGGQKHPLPQPFFVLATQNPIEQEGTYPLPEAQLDRFLMQVNMDYPTERDELEMIKATTGGVTPRVEPVLHEPQLRAFLELVRRIPIADPVAEYALRLTRQSRPQAATRHAFIREQLRWGAGPRGGQGLVLAAKARAALHGRYCVTLEDIRALARPVLRHRLRLSFAAEADGQTVDQVISWLLETIAADATNELTRTGVVSSA